MTLLKLGMSNAFNRSSFSWVGTRRLPHSHAHTNTPTHTRIRACAVYLRQEAVISHSVSQPRVHIKCEGKTGQSAEDESDLSEKNADVKGERNRSPQNRLDYFLPGMKQNCVNKGSLSDIGFYPERLQRSALRSFLSQRSVCPPLVLSSSSAAAAAAVDSLSLQKSILFQFTELLSRNQSGIKLTGQLYPVCLD